MLYSSRQSERVMASTVRFSSAASSAAQRGSLNTNRSRQTLVSITMRVGVSFSGTGIMCLVRKNVYLESYADSAFACKKSRPGDPSDQLITRLREFSPVQIGELMDLSDNLSALNVARYASWTHDTAEGRQAVMAFNGDVYGGLDARSLKPGQLDYAQARIRILSGLYGMLRPLDLIHPHRLEMGARLANPRGKYLYAI